MKAAALSLGLIAVTAASLTLDGNEVWVISSSEPPPVANALLLAQRDAYMVLGLVPVVLSSPPAAGSLPNGTIVVYLGSPAAAPWLTSFDLAGCLTGWESHCVKAFRAGSAGSAGYASIVATGEGNRGAIYGALSFSESVLGVNPWALFTDDMPEYVGTIAVDDTLALLWAPPKYKWRGLFINDEDLLANHRPDPLGAAAVDLRMYAEVIETLLRLKGNMIVPATNPFPDQEVYALTAAKGVVVSHHHYDLVGSNVFAWPMSSQDWSWTKDPGSMAALWRASINAQADLPEVLWSVGLRGLNDYAYPCSTPQDCGTQISEAMANQTAWIRALQPNASLVTYMWDEALGLLTQGLLAIPEGVRVIFTDAGAGYVRTDANFSAYAHGVYYHTAMYNSNANQLTEMVPVDRIVAQLGNATAHTNATDVILDNASDLKPCPMTTEAVLRFAWTPMDDTDPNVTAAAYYAAWGARQLHIPGGAAAPAAQAFALLWQQLFLVPYVQAGLSDNFLANALINAGTGAAADIIVNGSVPAAVVAAAQQALAQIGGPDVIPVLQALLANATALLAALPPSRQGFFTSHTLLQVSLHAYGASAILNTTAAVEAFARGQVAMALPFAVGALADCDAVLAALRAGESASGAAKWRGLYFGDHLTNFQRARAAVRSLVAALSAPASKGALPPVGPALWYEWDSANEETPAARESYPLLRYNPDVAFSVYVRSNCDWADIPTGACTPSADGGLFNPGAGGRVTLQVLMSQTAAGAPPPTFTGVIRYTTDGSAPTPASSAYVAGQPIQLDAVAAAGRATVRAAAFAHPAQGGQQIGGVTTTTWVAQ